MKNKGSVTLIALAVMGVLILGGVATSYFSPKVDSPVEQGIEGILRHQFDLDVDFSKEKKEEQEGEVTQ